MAAAFSPVLLNLGRNLALHPDDRVTLLAPLLWLLAGRRGEARPAVGRRDGLAGVAIGAALEVVGMLAGSWTLARLGLPVAAIGLSRWRAGPPLPRMALLFLAIPLPDSLVTLASPGWESALARWTSALLGGLGFSVEAVGVSLAGPGGRIDLAPAHGGATLAVACAALGGYAAVRAGAGIGRVALRAALSSLLAIPLQALALLIAGLLLAAGAPGAAALWLTTGAWLAVALLGLAGLHRPTRGRDGGSQFA